MMADKFKRKPETVEAVRFYGIESVGKIVEWMDSAMIGIEGTWQLHTPEGWAEIKPGEWIIRFGRHEYYRCPDGEFHDEYERL